VLYYFNLFFGENDEEFDTRVEEAMQGRRKVKLQTLFNMLDEDGNGALDLNEFGRMLRIFSSQAKDVVKSDDILETMVKIDRDHNRKVDYKEWLEYMNGLFATMDDRSFYRTVAKFTTAVRNERETRRKTGASTVHTPAAALAPTATAGAAAGAR